MKQTSKIILTCLLGFSMLRAEPSAQTCEIPENLSQMSLSETFHEVIKFSEGIGCRKDYAKAYIILMLLSRYQTDAGNYLYYQFVEMYTTEEQELQSKLEIRKILAKSFKPDARLKDVLNFETTKKQPLFTKNEVVNVTFVVAKQMPKHEKIELLKRLAILRENLVAEQKAFAVKFKPDYKACTLRSPIDCYLINVNFLFHNMILLADIYAKEVSGEKPMERGTVSEFQRLFTSCILYNQRSEAIYEDLRAISSP